MFSGTSICREYLKSEKCIGPGFPLLPTPPRPQPEWLAEAGISHPLWSPGACSPQPSPWGQPEAPAEDGEPNSDSPLSSTNCSLNGSKVIRHHLTILRRHVWVKRMKSYILLVFWQEEKKSLEPLPMFQALWTLTPTTPYSSWFRKPWAKRSFRDNVFFK